MLCRHLTLFCFQEKEKERQAELQKKKERAEKIFNEWLRNARNKPRPVLNGYGFPHGKSAGLYSYRAYAMTLGGKECYLRIMWYTKL